MSRFAKTLITWQKSAGRHGLPWQENRDPYRIWLSEVMLQQTQVDTVIPYFQRFVERFPDLATLAAAPLDAVLGLWSGLGYYARARNLHRCAQVIVEELGGSFPETPDAIAALPGIGRSTAAAIAAFSFGAHSAILDGNVKRVLCRHQGITGFPGERAVEQKLWALAEALLPKRDVDIYTQAMMDLGATVCTRSRPACAACPVAADCVARAQGLTDSLPTPRPKKTIPERRSAVLIARAGSSVLLEKRPPHGIWGGLYALPEIPASEEATVFATTLGLAPLGPIEALATVEHRFTHFLLHIEPRMLAVRPCALQDAARWRWASADEWAELGLPSPIRRLLDKLA
ncbi:A/G-specific adenine glycosylase [Niveibacterium terrae]|uniref:A/G-specific adenine glycosylase n=1 Tax=Niveibacterium terrae TaxID=3373598 RepID=UPI003A8F23EA